MKEYYQFVQNNWLGFLLAVIISAILGDIIGRKIYKWAKKKWGRKKIQ
jgi:hypothetical protein